MEKIGIGILTYNRKENLFNLLETINKNKTDDFFISVAKNKTINYGDESKISELCNEYIPIPDSSKTIAYCKNKLFESLLKNGCKHIFIIEDDVIIKDFSVFDIYIETAKTFNIGHLSHNCIDERPRTKIPSDKNKFELYLYLNLNGIFCYYSADCLMHCGLMDDRYENVIEHVEHTLRIAKLGYTYGQGYYADIKDSKNYIGMFNDKNIDEYDKDYFIKVIKSIDMIKKNYGNNFLKQSTIDEFLFQKFMFDNNKRMFNYIKYNLTNALDNSYCISLDDNRYDIFCKIFRKNNLYPIPKRFNAIKYNSFSLDNVKNNTVDSVPYKFLGPIGCTSSHVAIISHAKLLDIPYITIFEDDAYPRINVKPYLNEVIKHIPGDANIVILGYLYANIIKEEHDGYFCKANTVYGTHAYIVTCNGYDEYLKALRNENCVADSVFTKLPGVYVSKMNMFTQYNFIQSEISKKSGFFKNNNNEEFPNPDFYKDVI